MGFIKYSVVELGVEETVPGWIKQSSAAKATEESSEAVAPEEAPANKKTEEQEEAPTKDQ